VRCPQEAQCVDTIDLFLLMNPLQSRSPTRRHDVHRSAVPLFALRLEACFGAAGLAYDLAAGGGALADKPVVIFVGMKR
jgi:hypothetical protein